MTTTNHTTEPDAVVLGLLDHQSSHTHGDRVAHPRSGFIDEVDAVPSHDTSPDPAPGPLFTAIAASSPEPNSVTANNHATHPDRLRLKPPATTVVSLLSAIVVSTVGATAVWLASRAIDDGATISFLTIGSAAMCGLLLVTAVVIDMHRSRR